MSELFDFSGINAVIYKELRQILRSRFTLFLAIGVPLVQMLLLGYAINTTVEHVPAAVYNEDRGPAAQAFIDSLAGSRTFDVVAYVSSRKALLDTIVSGRVRAAFDIPQNFTADLLAGRDPAVGAFIDGSDSAIAQVAYGSAVTLSGIPLRNLTSGVTSPFEVRPVVLFNPAMRSANFFVPGLIGLVLQNITIMLTALAIVGERERGTLDQLLVTPIGTAGLMLGKLVPYVMVAALQFIAVLLGMRFVFNVPIAGSVLLLALLSLCFLLVSLGLGLFVSTVAQTQIQAQLMAIFILLPSVLVSGAVFERSLMPVPMQIFGYVIPLTYYIEILRGIIIRGAGVAQLWPSIVPMLAYGVIIFVMASIRFARTTR
ncbi:MAG TPA: ABC transporter permease [Candidatus Baltobacteraceae bacterium]|nr:ABC transporter permease [Candidatus Baltobacteraceae bacterium]